MSIQPINLCWEIYFFFFLSRFQFVLKKGFAERIQKYLKSVLFSHAFNFSWTLLGTISAWSCLQSIALCKMWCSPFYRGCGRSSWSSSLSKARLQLPCLTKVYDSCEILDHSCMFPPLYQAIGYSTSSCISAGSDPPSCI